MIGSAHGFSGLPGLGSGIGIKDTLPGWGRTGATKQARSGFSGLGALAPSDLDRCKRCKDKPPKPWESEFSWCAQHVSDCASLAAGAVTSKALSPITQATAAGTGVSGEWLDKPLKPEHQRKYGPIQVALKRFRDDTSYQAEWRADTTETNNGYGFVSLAVKKFDAGDLSGAKSSWDAAVRLRKQVVEARLKADKKTVEDGEGTPTSTPGQREKRPLPAPPASWVSMHKTGLLIGGAVVIVLGVGAVFMLRKR